jgi:hypothetical protein
MPGGNDSFRSASVHSIDGAAVVGARQRCPERVQDLHLVAALDVDTAVAPVLLRRPGAGLGHLELEVNPDVAEPPVAVEVARPWNHLHRPIHRLPARRRAIQVPPRGQPGAAEQNRRARRRWEVDQRADLHVPVEHLRSLGLESDAAPAQRAPAVTVVRLDVAGRVHPPAVHDVCRVPSRGEELEHVPSGRRLRFLGLQDLSAAKRHLLAARREPRRRRAGVGDGGRQARAGEHPGIPDRVLHDLELEAPRPDPVRQVHVVQQAAVARLVLPGSEGLRAPPVLEPEPVIVELVPAGEIPEVLGRPRRREPEDVEHVPFHPEDALWISVPAIRGQPAIEPAQGRVEQRLPGVLAQVDRRRPRIGHAGIAAWGWARVRRPSVRRWRRSRIIEPGIRHSPGIGHSPASGIPPSAQARQRLRAGSPRPVIPRR